MSGGNFIADALTSVNAAIQIAKAIKDASGAIEKAHLKLQMAEVIGALAEAKIALAESMDEARGKQSEITDLLQALRNKANVKRALDAYYETDQDGQPAGDPYCSHCWETSYKLIHLTSAHRGEMETQCPSCKAKYPRARSPLQINVKRENPA